MHIVAGPLFRRAEARPPAVRACALALGVLLAACSDPEEPAPVADPLAYVDPFIGTGGFAFAAASAYPGAMAPQGLVKAGPDTSGLWGTIQFLHYSGYWAGDDTVLAFTHMHLHGTGLADYGIIGVMPAAAFDPARRRAEDVKSTFRKENERAAPGYYSTLLDRDGIRAEITATTHAAHHRYTWAAQASGGALLFDLDRHLAGGKVHDAEIALDAAASRVRGRVRASGGLSGGYGGYEVWFEARTNRPWRKAHVYSNAAAPAEGTHANGEGTGAALEFDFADGVRTVELQVALSLVSAEGAAANLQTEMPTFDFEGVRARTAADWRALVGTMKVHGGTETQRRIFHTALFHAFLMPTIQSDADGRYRGHDKQVHAAQGFRYVTDLSLWDTYRTVHPLYAVVAPDRALDAVKSLHAMAREGGFFPKWPLAGGDSGCMLGASAEIVVADAYVRGLRDFDAEDAYARLRAAAMDEQAPPGGRGGRGDVQEYLTLGYVPATRGRSVSTTTEYAHNDFALGNFAQALGRTDDAQKLLARSKGYRKLFDPETRFLRGRMADGSLRPGPFNDTEWLEDYAEANAWHSLWMAAHDVDGLADLFGGRPAMLAKLEEFFEKAREYEEALERPDPLDPETSPLHKSFMARPYYWHGNEPDIQAAYMFAQAGRPDLAQKWARWIADTYYSDKPDGIFGNDDAGTMSAWYVFTALGLYPLPGSNRFVVGTPLFPKVEIAVRGGTFTIEAPGADAKNIYVRAVQLNGRALDKPEVTQGDLVPGGRLVFELADKPQDWGRR